MRTYNCTAIQSVIDAYINKGGEVYEIVPGCLGYGFTILHGDNLKTVVIKEKYVNCWTSTHTMRMYNKTPEKYKKIIEKYKESQEADNE